MKHNLILSVLFLAFISNAAFAAGNIYQCNLVTHTYEAVNQFTSEESRELGKNLDMAFEVKVDGSDVSKTYVHNNMFSVDVIVTQKGEYGEIYVNFINKDGTREILGSTSGPLRKNSRAITWLHIYKPFVWKAWRIKEVVVSCAYN